MQGSRHLPPALLLQLCVRCRSRVRMPLPRGVGAKLVQVWVGELGKAADPVSEFKMLILKCPGVRKQGRVAMEG